MLFDFSNALAQQGSPQTLSQIVLSGLDPYAQPPFADDYPDCTDCLETIDNRISATPVYMHGKVYATHDSAVDNGDDVNANVQWMIVQPVLDQPTSGCTLCTTISADTTLDDSGFITYPARRTPGSAPSSPIAKATRSSASSTARRRPRSRRAPPISLGG